MNENRYKKLISNTLVFAVGTFASKLMVYFLMPLYTQLLDPGQYSTADLITQMGNLLMPLAAVGIYDGMFRFAIDAIDDEERKKRVFSSGMAILTVGSVAFLALSPLLCLFDFIDGYAWLVLLFVISANFQYTCSNYVRALGKTKLYAGQGILNTALTIGFNVLFLVYLPIDNVIGYILSVILANAVVTVFLIVKERMARDFSVAAVNKATVAEMLRYSVPMIPTSVFWWVTSVSNRYIVDTVCGEAVNGLFAAAQKVPTLITLLTTVFIEAWNFSAVTESDSSDKESFFGTVFGSYMGLIFMAASGLIAFAKVFTVLLMADTYYESWQFMPTLTISMVFSAFTTFMGSVYIVKKKSVLSLVTSLTGAVVNVVLSIVLIPILGAQGAALASVVCYVAVFIIRTVTAQKYVKFDFHPARLVVNTLLVGVQCVLMVLEVPYWIAWQAIFCTAVLVFNGKTMLRGIILAIGGIKNKRIEKDGRS